MTPAEAAANEAAAFYSTPAGDTSIAARRRQRLEDELTLVDSLARIEMRQRHSALLADVRAGLPTSQLIQMHGVSYDVVHEARELAEGEVQ